MPQGATLDLPQTHEAMTFIKTMLLMPSAVNSVLLPWPSPVMHLQASLPFLSFDIGLQHETEAQNSINKMSYFDHIFVTVFPTNRRVSPFLSIITNARARRLLKRFDFHRCMPRRQETRQYRQHESPSAVKLSPFTPHVG